MYNGISYYFTPKNYASGAYKNTDDTTATGEVGWYKTNSDDHTHPVKQKTATQLGFYDMSGNVWNWLEEYVISDSPIFQLRLRRGGAWDSAESAYNAVSLVSNSPVISRVSNIGMRVARDAE